MNPHDLKLILLALAAIGVLVLLVTQWKKILRERMPEIFERVKPTADDGEKMIAQLHQKIGQLTVDLDWLKKKCKQLGLSLNDER